MNVKGILALLTLGAAIVSSGATGRTSTAAGLTECRAARVHYTPYPGGAAGLGRIPWVRAESSGLRLVGLLWYWPGQWRDQGIDRALIYPGGQAPEGTPNMKILWAFLSPKAKRLVSGRLIVQGQRLDGPGRTWQQFAPIGYAGQNGAPSFASIIVLPVEGCWRVRLSAGAARAQIVFQATKGL